MAIRHEKTAHKTLYSSKALPDTDIACTPTSAVSVTQYSESPTKAENSNQGESEGKRCLATVTDCPSSLSISSDKVRQAIKVLDFTTLHSEALSSNYMLLPHSKNPSPGDHEDDLLSAESSIPRVSDHTTSTRPFRCTPMRQTTHHTAYFQDDLPLPLGPMFDPLWNPEETRRAAIAGYARDLKRKMLSNAGLLG